MFTYIVSFISSSWSGSTIHLGGLVPKGTHKPLWSTASHFEELLSNIWNGKFVQTSNMPRARSINFIQMAVYIRSAVISALFDHFMTTLDPILSGLVGRLALRIVACLFCLFICASCENINVTLAPLPAPNIATGAKCSGTSAYSMGNLSRMYFLIYVVLIKTFTAFVWTNPSQTRTCRACMRTVSAIMPLTSIVFLSLLSISVLLNDKCDKPH